MTYTQLHFKIKIRKPYPFIGSKIRGMLGYALKEEVCINPSCKCEGCFASKECAFYSMYETANEAHDYRFDFKLESDKYKFSLLLFNDLSKHSKSMENAMKSAFAKENKELFVTTKTKRVKPKNQKSTTLKIEFLTPLRIKKRNTFLRKEVEILDILLSTHKRFLTLTKQPYEKKIFDTSYKVVMQNLYYKELTRRSNKQNSKMNFGGIMGEIIVSGVSKDVYEMLKIAEVIGVGKATTFGLGKIKIKEIC